MKKILYIITRIEKSSPNRVLENMVSGIDQNKYKIYILSLFDNKDVFQKYPNVDYLSLSLNNILDVFTKGKKLIRELEEKINPDIVHSHGIFPDYLNTFFKKPYKVCTLHCNIFEDYRYGYNKLKSLLMIKFHLWSLKRIDKVVCCSQSVFNEINKIKYSNLTFVENGIKNETIKANIDVRKELQIDKKEIVYIYVGNLSKGKNILSLTNMFENNIKDNEHFIILGYGELKEEIERIALKKENIHILGFKNDVYNYLSAADVYVSASLTEGLSISVLEALGNGLILFLSDIESHKEFFGKDNTYLGEYFSEEDFKLKLNNIRKRIGKIDKKDIIKYQNNHFSDKSMMKEYEVIYEGKK